MLSGAAFTLLALAALAAAPRPLPSVKAPVTPPPALQPARPSAPAVLAAPAAPTPAPEASPQAALTAAAAAFSAAPEDAGQAVYDRGGLEHLPHAVVALTGLHLDHLGKRTLSWRPAQEEALRRYEKAPKDRPFVIYVDGPLGAGKTTFGEQLAKRFASRLGESAVLNEDEDAHHIPYYGYFDLGPVISRIKEERPKVVVFSLSGDSHRQQLVDRPPDLYYFIRPSELARQWNMLKRAAALVWKADPGDKLDFAAHYAFSLFVTPATLLMDAFSFVKQHVAPSYGRAPDILVPNSLTRRLAQAARDLARRRPS